MLRLTAEDKGYILNLHFRDRWNFERIQSHLGHKNLESMQCLCHRSHKCAGSDNIEDILCTSSRAIGQGRKRYVEPGNKESVVIRHKVVDKYVDEELAEAVS